MDCCKLESMKRKIKHLLNRSVENGATEYEAETSAKLAYRLMVDYNIYKAEVENYEIDESKITQQTFKGTSTHKFHKLIYQGTANLYFCDYFYKSCNGTYHVITGEECNIEIVKQMSEHFIKICEQLAKQYKGYGKSFISSYKTGFACRLYQRLLDHKKNSLNKTTHNEPGSSLVLADIYEKTETAITKFYQENNVKIKTTSGVHYRDIDGYSMGKQAAEYVGLNQPLGQTNTKFIREVLQ